MPLLLSEMEPSQVPSSLATGAFVRHDVPSTPTPSADRGSVDLTVETVLLHGTEDVNVPVGTARWLAAQVSSARLIELRVSGHLFSVERPELVLESVGRA